MARQFNGTNQSLQSASSIDLSSAGTGLLTIACWLYWDAFANDDDFGLELSANWNTNAGSFNVRPNAADGTFLIGHGAGSSTYRARSFARPSAAAWHHYMCVLSTTAASGVLAYVDGTVQSMTTVFDTGGATWGTHVLYSMSRANTSLFGAGRMAGLGIWAGGLSAGNATTLASGVPPNYVGTPLYAWNICGKTSPEIALVGAVNLTVNGATLVDDPPLFTGCIVTPQIHPLAMTQRMG